MLSIGNIKLISPCMLAPMAGISDLPFRVVNRSFGCEFAFTEMISARSLVYRNKKTERMLSSIPSDSPLGLQLLGDDPQIMKKAMDILRKYKFDLIDVNAACPVSKVTRRGEGASLMNNPVILKKLLNAMVNNTKIPVTVKIRSGWDETSLNARDIALHARDAGIKALFIHGRTKAQGYRGRVNYKIIKDVKDALDIPVIASGDGFSPQLVKKMLDETGCDGVAIARGALGNPWIFQEINEFIRGGTITRRPTLKEIIATMTRHLNLCSDFHGEITGTMVFRKFFNWYTRGIPDMKHLRTKACRAKTKDQMTDVIKELGTIQGQQFASRELNAGPV
jgi:tRNA-dihydrouridine synthase B